VSRELIAKGEWGSAGARWCEDLARLAQEAGVTVQACGVSGPISQWAGGA
jgi:hypothetical protein